MKWEQSGRTGQLMWRLLSAFTSTLPYRCRPPPSLGSRSSQPIKNIVCHRYHVGAQIHSLLLNHDHIGTDQIGRILTAIRCQLVKMALLGL
jgi:hypothetical protein